MMIKYQNFDFHFRLIESSEVFLCSSTLFIHPLLPSLLPVLSFTSIHLSPYQQLL